MCTRTFAAGSVLGFQSIAMQAFRNDRKGREGVLSSLSDLSGTAPGQYCSDQTPTAITPSTTSASIKPDRGARSRTTSRDTSVTEARAPTASHSNKPYRVTVALRGAAPERYIRYWRFSRHATDVARSTLLTRCGNGRRSNRGRGSRGCNAAFRTGPVHRLAALRIGVHLAISQFKKSVRYCGLRSTGSRRRRRDR